MRRPLLLAAAVLAALVLAACGSDDAGDSTTADSTTTEAASVTRAEFIEMADAICLANDDSQDALRVQLDTVASPEEAASIYDQLADVSEQAVDEISALPRPEGDEATIDELAGVRTESVLLVRELADAVRGNDQATGEDLIARLQENAARGDEGDTAFGFQVC
jgi:hypothetical protein